MVVSIDFSPHKSTFYFRYIHGCKWIMYRVHRCIYEQSERYGILRIMSKSYYCTYTCSNYGVRDNLVEYPTIRAKMKANVKSEKLRSPQTKIGFGTTNFRCVSLIRVTLIQIYFPPATFTEVSDKPIEAARLGNSYDRKVTWQNIHENVDWIIAETIFIYTAEIECILCIYLYANRNCLVVGRKPSNKGAYFNILPNSWNASSWTKNISS